jgi:hypothetical protein
MIKSAAIVPLVGVLVLSGCFGTIDVSDAQRVDGPTTINASELAATAEAFVLEQGFTVEIDCGSDDVAFAVGTTLECSGLDPATGATGGYTVTITSVDGADYSLNVVGSEAATGDVVFETAAAFAALTAQAITESLGEAPIVDCGADDIEIFVGQEVGCTYETSTAAGFVIATVTSLEGTTYGISVVEG